MATVLLCSVDDLKRASVLSGNTDSDKIVQWMNIAHDTHLEEYLGTDLLARLREGVDNSDLTSNETSLLNNYVKKMAIHWCLVVIFGFLPYGASNKGTYKETSENSETLVKEENDSLVQQHRNFAQFYTRKFIDYMCYNSSLFPQYDSNTNEDTNPSQDASFNGWVL